LKLLECDYATWFPVRAYPFSGVFQFPMIGILLADLNRRIAKQGSARDPNTVFKADECVQLPEG